MGENGGILLLVLGIQVGCTEINKIRKGTRRNGSLNSVRPYEIFLDTRKLIKIQKFKPNFSNIY